jgi:hypothetical protein
MRLAAIGSFAATAVLIASPLCAQTLAEMRDAMEIMVNTSTICSDYLQRPEVMEEWQRRALENLTELGMAADEAEAFIAQAVAAARAETLTEVQKQVACEMVNVRALK